MPSEQIENYIKNIYKLQSNEGKVTTSSLSKNLNISPASVSEMIKKLAEEGTLTHTPYKGVELTGEGKKLALRIIRKHRLWEMFLVEVLHFKWDEIDHEAERFEHIMSDKMEEKIDHVLGHPLIDPHGDPIPTKEGELICSMSFPLTDADEGSTVRVMRVSDSNSELLQYVSSIGITLNKQIVVKQKMKFDNSMLLKINDKEVNVSPTIISSIFVENVA
ncbi:MAG: metal-dependent transcriptional regulator [Ignavibacteriales bacterium]|nr:metal-dependent transcriptional regulator [Ignavibacteriales bacterium]